MSDITIKVADLLFTNQLKIERGGYPLHTWDDWFNIASEWVECHNNWTVEQLYTGIKWYNYMFPENVTLSMVSDAMNWD